MLETVAFYAFAALTLGAAALVIGQKNPMYSVMLLIASFAGLSGLYIQLDAPFVAVAQIIIYAGAIMVLFLFVVMLLNTPREDASEWDRQHPLRHPAITRVGSVLALVLAVELAWVLARAAGWTVGVGSQAEPGSVASVAELGRVLFREHGFAFEATSILILTAMIGAVVLARREGHR